MKIAIILLLSLLIKLYLADEEDYSFLKKFENGRLVSLDEGECPNLKNDPIVREMIAKRNKRKAMASSSPSALTSDKTTTTKTAAVTTDSTSTAMTSKVSTGASSQTTIASSTAGATTKEIKSLKNLTLVDDCDSGKKILGGDGVVSLLQGGNIYEVYCDTVTDGGNWIVFQRRMDGSVDFYRTWEEYAAGFGNKTGEFWLGLETVHQLTQNGNYELRVDLTDWDGSTRYAKYGKFSISGRSDGHRLTVGEYSGNAGDSLNYHNGQQFSTKDKGSSCATTYHAAWWFASCAYSSLNGRYNDTSGGKSGVWWYHWGNRWYRSLKASEMKFRKK